MSFANQALAAEYLVDNAATLEQQGVRRARGDRHEIARLKLDDEGIDIDMLSGTR